MDENLALLSKLASFRLASSGGRCQFFLVGSLPILLEIQVCSRNEFEIPYLTPVLNALPDHQGKEHLGYLQSLAKHMSIKAKRP